MPDGNRRSESDRRSRFTRKGDRRKVSKPVKDDRRKGRERRTSDRRSKEDRRAR